MRLGFLGLLGRGGLVTEVFGGQSERKSSRYLGRSRIFALCFSSVEVHAILSYHYGRVVELCDPKGNALKGFSLGESEWLYGNEIEHVVHWGESIDVGGLAGQPVRLRIWLRDADLYSFQFADTPNTETTP